MTYTCPGNASNVVFINAVLRHRPNGLEVRYLLWVATPDLQGIPGSNPGWAHFAVELACCPLAVRRT